LDDQGRGWGDIFFVWSDSNAIKGELRDIVLNTSLTEVSFKAYKGTHGPIVYNLACNTE